MSFLNQAIGSNMLLSTRKNKKNEILKTYDYEIFKRIKGNRLVNNSHVNNLVKSMKEKYLPQPILVNKDMEIIDGQHRFAAAEELSLPIHYLIIDGGIGEVQRLNTNTKNWKNEDYLNMFCDREFEDYLLFKRFMKEYQFSLETTLLMAIVGAGICQLDNRMRPPKVTPVRKKIKIMIRVITFLNLLAFYVLD